MPNIITRFHVIAQGFTTPRKRASTSAPGHYRGLFLILLLGAGLGGLAPLAAIADNDGHRGRGHEQRGRNDGNRHREWRNEDRGYVYRPYYPQPYLYSQPVYVPPPVYYAPRQSPGISLFFPLDLRGATVCALSNRRVCWMR